MFLENKKIKDKIQKNERKIRGLELLIENLDRNVSNLFETAKVSPGKIQQLLSNPNNFSEEEKKQIQQLRQQQEEVLQRDLENIVNPQKAKQALSSNGKVLPHWLFVR